MAEASIYSSKVWKEIEPLARVHIILVAKKVKPGVTFGTFKNVREILDKLNLYYHIKLDTKRFAPLKFYTIHASFSQKLLKGILSPDATDKLWGKFYGYPACCVKKYVKEIKEGNPRRKFILQLLQLRKSEKAIPEELFYLMPTQVPCRPDCRKVLKILRIWRHTLENTDKEAADWFASWNRSEFEDEMEGIEKEIRKL